MLPSCTNPWSPSLIHWYIRSTVICRYLERGLSVRHKYERLLHCYPRNSLLPVKVPSHRVEQKKMYLAPTCIPVVEPQYLAFLTLPYGFATICLHLSSASLPHILPLLRSGWGGIGMILLLINSLYTWSATAANHTLGQKGSAEFESPTYSQALASREPPSQGYRNMKLQLLN